MNTENKLPIPDALTKKEFWKLFPKVPEHTLRKRINTIIYAFRKDFTENKGKNWKEIVRVHAIEKPELLEYFNTYAYPDKYLIEEN